MPISRDVKGIWELDSGPLLRASSSGNNVSSVWKRDPADLEIGSNLSVDPSVFFFVNPFLEVFFLDIAFIIASDRLKKAQPKKKDRQTDR